MPDVDVVSWNGANDGVIDLCVDLWERVWPGDKHTRRARMNERFDPLDEHLFHLAFDGDELVAIARTFHHTVQISDRETPIVALASVCSEPSRRGEGWGDAVVRSAFAHCAGAERLGLFQTGVPGFYERFGSRTISNRVFTSQPGASAFTDDFVMIHPNGPEWDEAAEIDLRMAGW